MRLYEFAFDHGESFGNRDHGYIGTDRILPQRVDKIPIGSNRVAAIRIKTMENLLNLRIIEIKASRIYERR